MVKRIGHSFFSIMFFTYEMIPYFILDVEIEIRSLKFRFYFNLSQKFEIRSSKYCSYFKFCMKIEIRIIESTNKENM